MKIQNINFNFKPKVNNKFYLQMEYQPLLTIYYKNTYLLLPNSYYILIFSHVYYIIFL